MYLCQADLPLAAHKTIAVPLALFYAAPTSAKAHEVTLGLRNIKDKINI